MGAPTAVPKSRISTSPPQQITGVGIPPDIHELATIDLVAVEVEERGSNVAECRIAQPLVSVAIRSAA